MASVEEFMATCFDESSGEESGDKLQAQPSSLVSIKQGSKKDKKRAKSSAKDKNTSEEKAKSKAKLSKKKKTLTDQEKEQRKSKYKESLNRLLEKDPSFKNFLKEHDADLLDFEPSSSSEDEDAEEEEEEKEEEDISDEEDQIGKEEPEDEDFSSSSDEEEEEEKTKEAKLTGDGREVLTVQTVKEWDKSLRKQPSFVTIRSVIQAFRAAVERSGADVESDLYVVEDRTSFNAIVRLCFTSLENALIKLLKLDSVASGNKPRFFGTKGHHKMNRYKTDIRIYLNDLIKLLGELQEADVIAVTLKHMGRLEALYSVFPRVAKTAMKEFVRVWSRKDENCRVLALLNINKLIRRDPETLDSTIKALYLSYVKNTKLVTGETWPLIQFMQKSFGEVCALDSEVAYRHAFVYIRQLAIHLRNAMISKKKDLVQAVYNWQYVQCLYLWSSVLSRLREEEGLTDMVYPLIQVVLGCIKLIPSAKYFPLRFHCCRILIQLAKSSSVYIPVIPEILEPLNSPKLFNKRHTKRSSKPLDFNCCLKLSKSQMEENGFTDAVIESIYELTIEAVNIEIRSLAFAELTIPCLVQLKSFCKNCKVGKYSRQIRSLADTIAEQGKFVNAFRKRNVVNLNDPRIMEALEIELCMSESPLKKFYASWKKMKARELQIQALAEKTEKQDKHKFSEQDESDGEEDFEEDGEVPKPKKTKKRESEQKVTEFEPDRKRIKANSEIILPKFEDLVQDLELSD